MTMTIAQLIEAERIGRYEDSPAYRVDGYGGIAWHFVAERCEERIIEPDWDTLVDDNGNPMDADVWWPDENDIETVGTGMAEMVMVGDDRIHVIDPADVTPIDHDAYCASCGQIGCRW